MKRIPFHYRIFRGAIGKRFVIKHYKGGKVVRTKYPDMSGIIPSEEQKACRRHFKRATAYAGKVYAKPALREEKRRVLRKPKRLFQALIKEWYAKRREKAFWQMRRIKRWQQNCKQNTPETLQIDLFQLKGPMLPAARSFQLRTHWHCQTSDLVNREHVKRELANREHVKT